ncbi:tRNA guanosine-2'-O-methyltransferase [Laetiporus sulphureus 93-53]|uniref:tRNA (guanine(10)-N(2))-methyltransferase n=1 Tax=Laetiporus sulphureus 93-53 TaxID=1314785 RepID=A0A165GRH2_9APHY|nr:tRNA guanosine-2'-O-methyltransferase [Laetiporus sulphureus 93-53]KZT10705.1 tRNA guanosine-2'-O-methyltransferase [Laetiporus sulphureus 93-53]
MGQKYLIIFAQAHADFRIPELRSVAELYGFDLTLPEEIDISRPFLVLELASEEHARLLARRCILIKSLCEFYAQGATYEEVHEQNHLLCNAWSRYIEDTSFKFIVTAYNHTIPQSRQKDIVESFSYMGFLGKIDMKNPEIIMVVYEEYIDKHGTTRDRCEGDGDFRQVYLGRLIEEGSARPLVKKFDVKGRTYYGNTSMEAEISLLMANQTLAAPGKLIYDPFIGTGSMAYTTAHFGALVYGSDIDGRQMRGKDKRPGIIRAAEQYGIADRIVDLCTFDVTRNPWRCGELFDAIITDPPYGVRAGAKRLGRKARPGKTQQEPTVKQSFVNRSDDQPYLPPTKPYELSSLASDLVVLARYMLKPNGRLVFFLPTVTDEYEELDVQTMMCDGMEVISNSLQNFGSWGRRLITIRKVTTERYLQPKFASKDLVEEGSMHVPAHKDFREKYFLGFKKKVQEEIVDSHERFSPPKSDAEEPIKESISSPRAGEDPVEDTLRDS